MTKLELARDKLKYWKLISRARKVGFKIPNHWMKYGEVPTNQSEIFQVCCDAYLIHIDRLFNRDDLFYVFIK